jgi:hypothetical protein
LALSFELDRDGSNAPFWSRARAEAGERYAE